MFSISLYRRDITPRDTTLSQDDNSAKRPRTITTVVKDKYRVYMPDYYLVLQLTYKLYNIHKSITETQLRRRI